MWVPMTLYPWARFELMGRPLTDAPVPHSVGCLLVFDDEETAREWANGASVKEIAEPAPEEARQ